MPLTCCIPRGQLPLVWHCTSSTDPLSCGTTPPVSEPAHASWQNATVVYLSQSQHPLSVSNCSALAACIFHLKHAIARRHFSSGRLWKYDFQPRRVFQLQNSFFLYCEPHAIIGELEPPAFGLQLAVIAVAAVPVLLEMGEDNLFGMDTFR